MVKKIDPRDLYTAILLFVVIIGLVVIRDKNKLQTVLDDFKEPIFIGFFIVIVIITFWGLTRDSKRIVDSTRNAMVGFLIAYLAHLDMVFAAFFLVGIFSYYSSQDV